MNLLMVRRLALPLVLLASASHAAESDSGRQLSERGRPVYVAAPPDTEATARVGELQYQLQAVESRLAKIESLLQNQMTLDLLKEIELMKAEVSRLRGQAEMQVHQMESLGKRQTDLYTDLDKRFEDLNKQVKTATLPPPPTTATAPPLALVASTQVSSAPAPSAAASNKPEASPQAPEASAPAEDPLAESKTYEAALNQFKIANYAASISGFKNFLKSYPGSSLASNAQYWIGYSYYALKDYKSALSYQQKLISLYPQSPKVPDAMLNMASSQAELEGDDAAKKTLEEIVAKHPGSNAAKIAARRLAAPK